MGEIITHVFPCLVSNLIFVFHNETSASEIERGYIKPRRVSLQYKIKAVKEKVLLEKEKSKNYEILVIEVGFPVLNAPSITECTFYRD